MKRMIALLCVAVMIMALAVGCGGKSEESDRIKLEVDGYLFEFVVTDVGRSEDGKVTVSMHMVSVGGENGEVLTDAMQIMRVAAMFLIQPYIIVDGERLDSTDDSQAGLTGTEDGRLIGGFTFFFDTDKEPDELWLYPSGREEETDWHYQINLEDYSILKNAEIAG